MTTQWRAIGSFVASSALFTGILNETQLFLLTYAEQTGTVEERLERTKQLLMDGLLPQRSRLSRKSIVERLSRRLLSWDPPPWILNDLVAFARQPTRFALQAALLFHVCRQDRLLYTLVQEIIVPKWRAGAVTIDSGDVQSFLDSERGPHPEIESWTRQTRERLGTTTLSLLRDYGLLQGRAKKKIVEPIVPDEAVAHAVRALQAEGLAASEIPGHPDWRLWLWSEERVRRALAELGFA